MESVVDHSPAIHVVEPLQLRPRRSLRLTLLLWFMGISLVPLGLISWLGYRRIAAEQLGADLADVRLTVILVLFGVAFTVALASFMVSRRIVLPLADLGHLMQRVADGHDICNYERSGHNEVGDLEDKFLQMVDRLQVASEIRGRQLALQKAQFDLHRRLSGLQEPQEVARVVLETVGSYYGAPVGVMYLDNEGPAFTRISHFGLPEDKLPPVEISPGCGVVGRVIQEGEIRILDNLLANHLPVVSSLGAFLPQTLLIAPFRVAGRVRAVLELGLLEKMAPGQLEFLQLETEGISVALDMAFSRQRADQLLAETRSQAWKLSVQQRQLQETNDRLASSDRYKSEFLANMSHELRTPLNSMLLMSSVLAENSRGNLSAEEVESVRTIHQAGRDLLLIINDILDLSLVEAGKLDVKPHAVDLDAIIGHLEGLFAPVAREKGLNFRVIREDGVPDRIVTDENRLNQILTNLLGNAFKFTASGSVVLRVRPVAPGEMETKEQGRSLTRLAFSVADTGIGMTSEQMTRVFDNFTQGDGSIGRRFGGTGLGLSISRKLAHLLGGEITVESLAGTGSTLTVHLPCPVSQAVANGPVLPAPVAGVEAGRGVVERKTPGREGAPGLVPDPVWDGWRSRRTLVCSGDMRAAFVISGTLVRDGAEVSIARSWEQGLELWRTAGPFDLVFLDDQMHKGGAGVLRARWNTLADCTAPVVVMTADEPSGLDVDPYLIKPIDTARLHAVGREVLAGETVGCC